MSHPLITVEDVVVGEGRGYVDFVVRLSAPSTNVVSVNYGTSNSTASYDDYDGVSGTLSFAPGEVVKTVRVILEDDAVAELREGFWLSLGGAVNAQIGRADAVGTIVDDDTVASSTYSISPASTSIGESSGVLTFTVTRSNPTDAQTVYVSTVQDQGSVNAGDYGGLLNQELTFAAGQASRTVTIQIYNDTVREVDQSFGLIVQTAPTDPIDTYLASAVFTIRDDDSPPPPLAPTPFSLLTSINAAVMAYNTTDAPPGFGRAAVYENGTTGLYAVLFEGTDGNAGQYILAFRGTERSPQDVDADANFGWSQWVAAPGEIDREEILAGLQTLVFANGGTLHVTGHSLGGALAQFCTYELIQREIVDQPAQLTLYTWNALGGEAGLRENLGSAYIPTLVTNAGYDVRHFGHPDDIVIRLGDGHLPGQNFFLNLPDVAAVDFLFAHGSGWLESMIVSGVGPMPVQWASDPTHYISIPEVPNTLKAQIAAVVAYYTDIANGTGDFLLGLKAGVAIAGSLPYFPAFYDLWIALAENITRAAWAGRDGALSDVAQQFTNHIVALLEGIAQGSVLAAGAYSVWVQEQLQAALDLYLTSVDSLGGVIDVVAKATADIILSVVGRAIDALKAGADLTANFVDGLDHLLDYFLKAGNLVDYASVLVATIDAPNLLGNLGKDLLFGSDGNNEISAGAGDDVIVTGGGSDSIVGTVADFVGDRIVDFFSTDLIRVLGASFGLGQISTRSGSLILDVDLNQDGMSDFSISLEGDFAGRLVVQSQGGDTTIRFESVVISGALMGSTAADVIAGSRDSDVIRALEGSDRVIGREGNDSLDGGSGNDVLIGGSGDDTLIGGDGVDTSDYSDSDSAVTVRLALNTPQNTGGAGIDTLAGVENVRGSSAADVLDGSLVANLLEGLGGNDLLWGGEGNDTLDGGAEDDELVVTPWDGQDVLIGGEGTDFVSFQPSWWGVFAVLSQGAYGDTLTGIEGLTGSNFDDVLSAGTLPAKLYGGMGNDVLVGGPGADLLNGGFGDDYLYVTAYDGADVIDGGPGYDILSYGGANTPLYIDLSFLYGDSVTGIEAVQGSKFDDTMVGTAGNDRIDGNEGNDLINSGAGDDVILMRNWDGADTVNGGEGADTVSYEIANTGVSASLASPTYGDTFTGIEHLTGSAYADTLVGDGNANRLAGLAGNDTLTGGAGSDTFVFNTTPNVLTNLDTILDFVSGTDKLEFSKSVFAGLVGTGALSADQFRSGAGVTSAQDADDRFVYDTSTGALYYDADGVGGVAAVQVALLGTTTHPGLAHTDIVIGNP